MAPSIDFSEVKDLEPVPNGTYEAEIVHAQEGISKNGNPKIDLRWKILDGEFAGRQVFDVMTFTANALFRVKATLKALGFPEGFRGEITAGDLVGLQATLIVSVESGGVNEETGEEYGARNRVAKVKPLGSNVSTLLG